MIIKILYYYFYTTMASYQIEGTGMRAVRVKNIVKVKGKLLTFSDSEIRVTNMGKEVFQVFSPAPLHLKKHFMCFNLI